MITSKALAGILGCSALVGAAFFVSWRVHLELGLPGAWLTILVGLGGVASGWLLGFLASPYERQEGQRFAKYASLISLFLSGYAIAKIDPVLDEVLAGTLTQEAYGLRIGVFFSCLIPSAIEMYVFRLYTGLPDPGVGQSLGTPPQQGPAPSDPATGEDHEERGRAGRAHR